MQAQFFCSHPQRIGFNQYGKHKLKPSHKYPYEQIHHQTNLVASSPQIQEDLDHEYQWHHHNSKAAFHVTLKHRLKIEIEIPSELLG